MGDSLVVIPSTAGQEWIKVALPDGREGWVNRSDFMETDKWRARNAAMTPEERIEEIIRLAVGMLGTPYVWGGLSTVGLDCSGLTRLCFSMAGMDIPRNSGPQFTTGIAVPFREDELTGWELDSLKRGDLVFFGKTGKKTEDTKVSHVGIYLGNGKFIQSSHFVRINSLYRSDADVYENAHKLVGVKRLIGR